MKISEPSVLQVITYIAKKLGKGMVIAEYEFKENLNHLGYSNEKIKEALELTSRGDNGCPQIFLKEGDVYTTLYDPKEIVCYIPSEFEDMVLEDILKKFIPKKEV